MTNRNPAFLSPKAIIVILEHANPELFVQKSNLLNDVLAGWPHNRSPTYRSRMIPRVPMDILAGHLDIVLLVEVWDD